LHPSADDSDFEDEEFTPALPEGATPEQAQALADAVVEAIEKIGLYAKHCHLAVTEPDPFDESHLMIHAVCTFGKVAFTPRVQNPEREELDDAFEQITHSLETDSIRDGVLKDFGL
jgi:hypothetical protein